MKETEHFLDQPIARFFALFIALALLTSMFFIWKDDFFISNNNENVQTQDKIDNPNYVKCIKNRVAAVNKMKTDGVVSEQQYQIFKDRAINYCRTKYLLKPL